MAYFGNKPSDQAIKIGDNTILSSMIDDGVIVDADINASASISVSKTQLAGGTGLTLSTNTLSVDASQTQITSVGTIGTGVWQGTKVASAYLDDDTAHLSGTQTFSGAKTFSATVLIDGVSNYTGLEVKGSGGSRPQIQWSNANDGDLGVIYATEGQALVIGTGNSNTTALTLDSSQNSTFAGSIWGTGGSATNPSIAFSSDADTGLYKEGTNSLGFTAGGVKCATMGDSYLGIFGKDTENVSLLLYADRGDSDNDKYRRWWRWIQNSMGRFR